VKAQGPPLGLLIFTLSNFHIFTLFFATFAASIFHMISVKNVTLAYGKRVLFEDVDTNEANRHEESLQQKEIDYTRIDL
jgi:hypothetical protein